MKDFTKIERSFWESDEARDMTPEEKYFWFYLQTNGNVNTLGCYIFRMRRAADETGYNQETIEKLLHRMVELERIAWDVQTGEVFLVHFAELCWNRQTATLRAITSDLKAVKSRHMLDILEEMLEKRGIFGARKPEEEPKEDKKEHFGTTGNKQGEEEEEEEEEERKEKTKKEKVLIYPAMKGNEYSEIFSRFWESYPNKKNKGKAAKAWDKLKVDEDLLGRIQHGLAAAKVSRDWTKDGGEYIPHPATWLNSRGWESEYTPANSGTKTAERPMESAGGRNDDAMSRRMAALRG